MTKGYAFYKKVQINNILNIKYKQQKLYLENGKTQSNQHSTFTSAMDNLIFIHFLSFLSLLVSQMRTPQP